MIEALGSGAEAASLGCIESCQSACVVSTWRKIRHLESRLRVSSHAAVEKPERDFPFLMEANLRLADQGRVRRTLFFFSLHILPAHKGSSVRFRQGNC